MHKEGSHSRQQESQAVNVSSKYKYCTYLSCYPSTHLKHIYKISQKVLTRSNGLTPFHLCSPIQQSLPVLIDNFSQTVRGQGGGAVHQTCRFQYLALGVDVGDAGLHPKEVKENYNGNDGGSRQHSAKREGEECQEELVDEFNYRAHACVHCRRAEFL
jgi:hypothetical protein